MTGNLELILTGFGIVLGVLAMLWAVTAAIGTVFKTANTGRGGVPVATGKSAKMAPRAVPSNAPPPAAGGVPARHLAVIAAAVAALVGRPHRLVGVRAHGPLRPHLPVWAQQGLFEHFASHHANLARWESRNGN